MKIFLTTIAVMLLMCSISSAAIYYVDNFGNDINTGLSESSPWKTISKVNSKTFQSGDVILFKKGGQWYETLTIRQDNLTFGAYGTGNLPLIDGQMTRTYNIYMNGRSGITIRDFHLVNSAGSGSVRIESCNNSLVENCEIYVTGHGGVFLQNSRNCTVRGISVTTPDNTDAQTDGIYSQRNNGNIYEKNYMIITNGNTTPHVDGIQSYLDTSITARNNYIEQRNTKSGNAQGIYATNTYGCFYFYNNIINTPYIMSNSLALKNLDATLYKGTIVVYHNTVITRGGNALCIQNAPDFIAKNNIFISKGTTYAVTIIGSYNGGNLNYNQYMNYGSDPSVVRLENDGGNHSLSMLQAKGLELNGQFGDPVIGIDYIPAQNSPVLDKGTIVSLCQLDKNGTLRPQGPSSDFGALERITTGSTVILPNAPETLTALKNSSSAINLSWVDVSSNEKGFYIERFDGNWIRIAVLGPNVTSYPDANLQAATTYSYRVQSFNDAGSSAYSNTASATTDAIAPDLTEYILVEAKTGTLSGGAVLTAKAGSLADQVVQFNSKSKAEYIITLPIEADWYIQGRFYHLLRSNAFTVQLNGGSKMIFSNNKITEQWAVGPKVFLGRIAAGTYTITITNSKPIQSLFDNFSLSTNSNVNLSLPFTSNEETQLRNYPNPFNPSTKVSFRIPVTTNVEISIYNSIGEKVADLLNEIKSAGYFEVEWNASKMASGIYFCRMRAGDLNYIQKMILTK